MSQTSVLGRFSVDYNRGCSPLTVNVTVNDTLGNITRQYIYEPGQTETNNTTHTFTQPGTYEIIQIISNINPRTDTLAVEVIEPTDPTFQIFSCAQNAARIQLLDSTYDFYRIFYNGDSVTMGPAELSPVLAFGNSNIQAITIRGYYNNAADNCAEVNFNYQPVNQLNQPQIANVNATQSCIYLLNITADVVLTTNVRHIVEVSDGNGVFQTVDTIMNVNTISLNGILLNANTTTLRIQAIDECTNQTILAETFTINNLVTTIPSIDNISANYLNRRASLNWDQQTFENLTFEVFQRTNGGSFSSIGSSTANGFTTQGLNPSQNQYDFYVISSDSCGNSSVPSIVATPVYLIFEKEQNNIFDLSWNSYEGWFSGVDNYVLEVLDADDQVLELVQLQEPNSKLLNITNLAGNRFRIRVTSVEGNYVAYSNIIVLTKTKSIIMPDAFSPNGDGINDVLLPILNSANNYEFLIYNMWGELIFKSTSVFEGWDGRYERGIVDAGTYVYKIKYENDQGEVYEQTGSFLLLR